MLGMDGMTAHLLKGKVVLVTGGGEGIGAAAARRLATAGADVAISYLHSAQPATDVVAELTVLGVRAVAVEADQADPNDVIGMVHEVARHFGHIDVLVNNAGIMQGGLLRDPTANGEQFATNVRGVQTTTQETVKYMGEGGRVILLSSIPAACAAAVGFGGYVPSRVALEAHGRAWSRDLEPRGITVNTLQCGFIDTDMLPASWSDFGTAMRRGIALEGFGAFEEAAEVIAFIAGPESSYITGWTIRVDAGWNA